jgi:hypothetical protein
MCGYINTFIYTKQQEREREKPGGFSLNFHPHLFSFSWKGERKRKKEDEAVTRSQSHLSFSLWHSYSPSQKRFLTSKDFSAAVFGSQSNINLASLPLLICFDCIPQPKLKGRVGSGSGGEDDK